MTTHRPGRPVGLAAAALAAVLALAGCDRKDEHLTAGQQLDRAIAKTERKADELEADASRALSRASDKLADASHDAKDRTTEATDKGGNAVADAAVTTSVNAALAQDRELSALAIDVDTSDGKVVLHGRAPNEQAKQRATQLAAQVRGVQSVDNQLDVRTR